MRLIVKIKFPPTVRWGGKKSHRNFRQCKPQPHGCTFRQNPGKATREVKVDSRVRMPGGWVLCYPALVLSSQRNTHSFYLSLSLCLFLSTLATTQLLSLTLFQDLPEKGSIDSTGTNIPLGRAIAKPLLDKEQLLRLIQPTEKMGMGQFIRF
jgi:hypothetical protein